MIVLIGTGWWMLELIRDPLRMKSAFPIFQFHNSLGVLVFAITLARIALRLRRKAPSLLAGMPGWERLTAFVAQATFYLLLVIIPVTGWLYISTE
ncbi:MAG TPA: cytochrome b/b6 domain-containing protein, partial [Rhizorhapis sp.]|nr:cytochrome b/b6 domain-containing protein [Rhizorhapis sp.]